jgi:poly(3-hydroxybutyrate) depolymerase
MADNAGMGREGRSGAESLEYRTLDVAGVRRGYWVARAPDGDGAPGAGALLVVLHGSGISGKDVATVFSGLAVRGPEAGVSVVFPDGWGEVWHIARPPAGEPRLDDVAFLGDLVRHLSATSVVLAGLSNGAGFAEHVARHGLLRVAGLFLVAGTFREFSRQAQPVPLQRTAVTIISGTGDRGLQPASPSSVPTAHPIMTHWCPCGRDAGCCDHGTIPAVTSSASLHTIPAGS